jgi:hypothetical protein
MNESSTKTIVSEKGEGKNGFDSHIVGKLGFSDMGSENQREREVYNGS